MEPSIVVASSNSRLLLALISKPDLSHLIDYIRLASLNLFSPILDFIERSNLCAISGIVCYVRHELEWERTNENNSRRFVTAMIVRKLNVAIDDRIILSDRQNA